MGRVTAIAGMSLTVLTCCAFCFACERTAQSGHAQPKLAASQTPVPVVNSPVQTPPSAPATAPPQRSPERATGRARWAEFFDSLGEQTWVTAPFMRPSDWHRVGERAFGVRVVRAHIDTSEGLSLWLTWALPYEETVDAQRTLAATSIRVTGPGVDSTVRLQTCPRARSFEELPVIINADGQLRSYGRTGQVKLADARLPFPLAPGRYHLHVTTRMVSERDGKRTASGHAVAIPFSVRERRDGSSALDHALAKAQTYLESRLPTGRKLMIERARIQDFTSGEMLATFDLEGIYYPIGVRLDQRERVVGMVREFYCVSSSRPRCGVVDPDYVCTRPPFYEPRAAAIVCPGSERWGTSNSDGNGCDPSDPLCGL